MKGLISSFVRFCRILSDFVKYYIFQQTEENILQEDSFWSFWDGFFDEEMFLLDNPKKSREYL
jgi:hypothetical protein